MTSWPFPIDLASVNGHHVPGTPDTYKHGWLPTTGVTEGNTPEPGSAKSVTYKAESTVVKTARTQHASMATVAHVSVTNKRYVDQKIEEQNAKIQQMTKQLQDIGEEHEGAKAKMKLATHMAVIAGGAVLGLVLAHSGLSDVIASIIAAAPLTIQEIVDYFKKI